MKDFDKNILNKLRIDDKELLVRFEDKEVYIYCVYSNEFKCMNYDMFKLLLLIKEFGKEQVLNRFKSNYKLQNKLKEMISNLKL